jgi:GTP-binding protein
LAFLIDLSQPDFLEHFDILLKEVGEFSPELARRKRVLVGTKIDLLESLRPLEELQSKYPNEQVVGISSLTRQGLDTLVQLFLRLSKEEE